jgi:two-component system, cell cycle sensor histidine kinase and response regulator CckA
VSDERKQRYFRREGDAYRVVEQLRDVCVFSMHDLFRDPPPLTHQLLTFAKGGAPRRSAGDLVHVLESAVRFGLSGSNVSPRFSHDREPWYCMFDPNQIARVFENIVINARQAMPAGGTVSVRASNVEVAPENALGLSPGRYVLVSIRDTGTGIDERHLPRIFDPFFTTKSSGSGLGLAAAYSIVQQHDGAIDVETKQGEGTSFHVYLPATDRPAVAVRAPVVPAVGSLGRVLVMDDQEAVARAVAGMLRALGCEVVVASEGEQALKVFADELAAGRNFAALLLDLTVPGGAGGREIAERIRVLDPGVPIVAMSGYSEDEVISQPSKFGFTHSIAKPLLKNDLAALFERIESER